MVGPLFESGQFAWIVLGLMAVEAVVLAGLLKHYPALLLSLFAGAALVLALRAAVLDHQPLEIAVFLLLSLIAHAIEIWMWIKLRRSEV